jgi:hypothetical protein
MAESAAEGTLVMAGEYANPLRLAINTSAAVIQTRFIGIRLLFIVAMLSPLIIFRSARI